MPGEAWSPAACAAAHKDVVTKSHLLSWVGTIAAFVVALAVAWGALQMRVAYLEAETATMQSQVEWQSRQAIDLNQKLAILSNDMAWQVEATKIIAQKLEVSIPMKR